MDTQRCVLIVDHSEETREVLETALERRGMRILSADRTDSALDLARCHHPDLIVVDLELDDANPESLCEFADHSCNTPPLVMLGSVRRGQTGLPDGEFVAKPYHYGPLIRRIEELLDTYKP